MSQRTNRSTEAADQIVRDIQINPGGIGYRQRSRCQKRHAAIDIPDILPCLKTNASWPIDWRFKTTHFEDGCDRQG